MQKNTSSLFIIWGNTLLLLPSKAGHKIDGQMDPPSCSICFTSEQERVEHMMNQMVNKKLSDKNFRKKFHFLEKPIKFTHKDEMGEKMFTGYVSIVKSDSTPMDNFIVDETETWEPINMIIDQRTGITLSPMFKKAIGEVADILKSFQRKFRNFSNI